jgi:hypothetical protein
MNTGDHLKEPQPWKPESDPAVLATLGKLIEELNEAGSAAARCIIQGMHEAEPTTGKINREWLLEELSDVNALINYALLLLNRTHDERREYIMRRERKTQHISSWLTHLKNEKSASGDVTDSCGCVFCDLDLSPATTPTGVNYHVVKDEHGSSVHIVCHKR